MVFRWYLVVVGGVWPVSSGNFVEFWRISVDFEGFFGFSVVRGAGFGGFAGISVVLQYIRGFLSCFSTLGCQNDNFNGF